MSTENYNTRDTLDTIRWALRKNDLKTLRKCNMALRAHNDEKMLLELGGEEYEKYHRMLFITTIEKEVMNRN